MAEVIQGTPALRLVDEEEAEVIAARQRALALFEGRYAGRNGSQRVMTSALRTVAGFFSDKDVVDAPEWKSTRWRAFEWECLVLPEIVQLVGVKVRSLYSRGRVNNIEVAMRRIMHYCVLVGLVSDSQVTLARKEFRELPGERKTGTYLTPNDIGALVEACRAARNPMTRARDTAMVLMLAGTGMRRDELMSLTFTELDMKRRRLNLVVTKGGKPRVVFLQPPVMKALEHWVKLGRPEKKGALFVPLTRSGNVMAERALSPFQLWKVVKRRCREAGLPPTVSPHDFRRYAICQMIDGGSDLATIARVVGHTRLKSTMVYDVRPTERARDAQATIDLPADVPRPARRTSPPPGRVRRSRV